MFPTTNQRVVEHTPPEINEKIRSATWQHVYQFAGATPETITQRLHKLDREWDVERMMEMTMAVLALMGLGLAIFITWWFVVIPVALAVLQLTHAIQGWCPVLAVLRKWGFRTQGEIDQEKYALKALRGDFRGVGDATTTPAPDRAAQAFIAAQV